MYLGGHRISVATNAIGRFWQVAMATAAGMVLVPPQADAALYYWQDSDPGFYRPAQQAQPRQPRSRRHSAGRKQAAEKDASTKPQGPLIVAISIEKQRVRVYDTNGLFAESPVSTGMRGHPTPMGVFSIIQKHKLHHSNIYSGAPMPYMQRITWSGVAMHAGVLPGYPASHGCIRMPMAFAMKMWNWTRMGARVVITPGEITPANFSHPLLVAQKVMPPPPMVADEPKPDAPLAMKSDKGADAGAVLKPSAITASLDLRSTVGHAQAPPREQTRTADASGAMPATNAPATMSDAAPSAGILSGSREPSSVTSEPPGSEAKSEPSISDEAKSEVEKAPPENTEAVATDTSDKDGAKADRAEGVSPAGVDARKIDENAIEAMVETKSDAVKAEAPVDPSKVETTAPELAKADAPKPESSKAPDSLKTDDSKAVEKPADTVKAAAAAAAIDVKKDPARLPGVEKIAAAKPEPPKRAGPIAVFISRKDSKLYVRQNFAPLFDVPVTIAPSDHILGTHVFTAVADKNDANMLRWSVVSLPVTARNAVRSDDDDRAARRRKIAGSAPVEAKTVPVPNTPAEALDRISIPPDAMARITEALTTGGSIVVSDQGINQGETGEGTDFIVPLR